MPPYTISPIVQRRPSSIVNVTLTRFRPASTDSEGIHRYLEKSVPLVESGYPIEILANLVHIEVNRGTADFAADPPVQPAHKTGRRFFDLHDVVQCAV
jgi:hypothetical protein